jgi:hypothetical protein
MMQRRHRSAHRRVWVLLSVLLPVLLLAALAFRQNGPAESAPIRLSEPLR